MIDQAARSRLFEDKKTKTLVDGMREAIISAVGQANGKKESDGEILKLMVNHKDDEKVVTVLDKIAQAMVVLYRQVSKPIVLPKVFSVTGKVEADIKKMPPVNVQNLKDLESYFQNLSQQVSNLAHAISSVPQTKMEAPKIVFPKDLIPTQDNGPLLGVLEGLRKDFKKLGTNEDLTDAFYRVEQAVLQLSNRPQMTPPPVTNMSVNPLHGIVKTTAVTVGTAAVQLPLYGQLPMRRSIILYNNSANTVFFGGSDVTTSNGTPLVTQSFSPSIDAGYDMILYGIAATPGNDIRVLEVSSTTQTVPGTTLI